MSYPEHLDKNAFNDLLEQIKDTNIGQKLMQHILECEDCRDKSIKLNIQASEHVRKLEELT